MKDMKINITEEEDHRCFGTRFQNLDKKRKKRIFKEVSVPMDGEEGWDRGMNSLEFGKNTRIQ